MALRKLKTAPQKVLIRGIFRMVNFQLGIVTLVKGPHEIPNTNVN